MPSKHLIPENFEKIRENIEEEQEFDLTDKEVSIIVCIKLPFSVIKSDNGSLSLVKTTSLLYSKMYDRDPDSKVEEWWIGWSGYFPESEEEEQEMNKLFRDKKCIPINIEEPVIAEFYSFYEKDVIPLFHNFKTQFEHKESFDEYYEKVNKIFAECCEKFIDEEVRPRGKNPVIWLNNQHLILTPKYLRATKKDYAIGLYLHSPFPTTEIFKLIPYRTNLIKSLLSCD